MKLARILEPEVMDTPEEAIDYDTMDHSQVNRVFVEDFLRVWHGQGPILDLGTGTALIPIELCRQDARAHVVAIDAAGHMLDRAALNVRSAGLEERIRLERVDAKRLPYPDGHFPAVISNSIIHHIPEPATCIAEMLRVLASGGVLFVRDLLRPVDEETLAHLVDLHAAGATEHQRKMFRESLNAALSLDELRHIVAQTNLDPLEVQQTTDRHWTWITRKP